MQPHLCVRFTRSLGIPSALYVGPLTKQGVEPLNERFPNTFSSSMPGTVPHYRSYNLSLLYVHAYPFC